MERADNMERSSSRVPINQWGGHVSQAAFDVQVQRIAEMTDEASADDETDEDTRTPEEYDSADEGDELVTDDINAGEDESLDSTVHALLLQNRLNYQNRFDSYQNNIHTFPDDVSNPSDDERHVFEEELDMNYDNSSSDDTDNGASGIDYDASINEIMNEFINIAPSDHGSEESEGEYGEAEPSNNQDIEMAYGGEGSVVEEGQTGSGEAARSNDIEMAYGGEGTVGTEEIRAESGASTNTFTLALRPVASRNPEPQRPDTYYLAAIQKVKLQVEKKEIQCQDAHGELEATEKELYAILEKLALLKQQLPKLETQKEEMENHLTSTLQNSHMSAQLYHEYEAFCESLNPLYGQRGGFSVGTDVAHQGDYIHYDPDFSLFKEWAEGEMSYEQCNYRVETPLSRTLEFWPLKCPERRAWEVQDPFISIMGEYQTRSRKVLAMTWGQQYPVLFELLIEAVKEHNCKIAMGMLLRLPDKDEDFAGGWMFVYQPDPLCANHPVMSKRWTFYSAHNILAPTTYDEKLRRVQAMLASA